VPSSPLPSPVLLVSERGITAGALQVNDAYDLSLYRMPDGHFELVLFMKLQFFFEPGSGGDWTEAERQQYLRDWRAAILSAWSGWHVHRTSCGRSVSMRLDFAIQTGGWMLDHWEITVEKIAAGSFSPSYVEARSRAVRLDSEDLVPLTRCGTLTQRGAVHEFGHMLGLADEYAASGAHCDDLDSIMNHSEVLRPRHQETMREWVIRKLAEHGFQ
jgi:hypothetical protein